MNASNTAQVQQQLQSQYPQYQFEFQGAQGGSQVKWSAIHNTSSEKIEGSSSEASLLSDIQQRLDQISS